MAASSVTPPWSTGPDSAAVRSDPASEIRDRAEKPPLDSPYSNRTLADRPLVATWWPEAARCVQILPAWRLNSTFQQDRLATERTAPWHRPWPACAPGTHGDSSHG